MTNPPTHEVRISIPLNLNANPAAESWDINGALAEAVWVLLPVLSLGTLGLTCGGVRVEVVPVDPRQND